MDFKKNPKNMQVDFVSYMQELITLLIFYKL